MIESKEQYERARKAHALLYQGDDEEIHSTALIETIEALREVARAATEYWQAERLTQDTDAAQLELALMALPDWILE